MATISEDQALSPRKRRTLILDIAVVALLLAGAFLVHPWDSQLSDAMVRFPVHSDHLAAQVVRSLGKTDVAGFCILLLAWALSDRLLLWRFTLSMTAAGILVWIFKLAVGRQRPNGASAHVSFPSGDAATAFVWAAVLAAGYPAAAVPVFLVAAAVAILRVTGGYHYPSDILAGAAIGYLAARYAVRRVNRIPGLLYRLTYGVRLLVISIVAVVAVGVSRALSGHNLAAPIVAATVVVVSVAIHQVRERR